LSPILSVLPEERNARAKIDAPLAAATSTAQLDQLFAASKLTLTAEEVTLLDEASASFR